MEDHCAALSAWMARLPPPALCAIEDRIDLGLGDPLGEEGPGSPRGPEAREDGPGRSERRWARRRHSLGEALDILHSRIEDHEERMRFAQLCSDSDDTDGSDRLAPHRIREACVWAALHTLTEWHTAMKWEDKLPPEAVCIIEDCIAQGLEDPSPLRRPAHLRPDRRDIPTFGLEGALELGSGEESYPESYESYDVQEW